MAMHSAENAETQPPNQDASSSIAGALRLPFIAHCAIHASSTPFSTVSCQIAQNLLHTAPIHSSNIQQTVLPLLSIISLQLWRFSQQSSFPILLQIGDQERINPSQVMTSIDSQQSLTQLSQAFAKFNSTRKSIDSTDLFICAHKVQTPCESEHHAHQLSLAIQRLKKPPMLTIMLTVTPEVIDFSWIFDPNRCDKRAIIQWKALVEVAAKNYLKNAHRALSQLSFTLDDNSSSMIRKQVDKGIKPTETIVETTIPYCTIEQMASRYPKHNAAHYNTESINYEELNQRSNQLAHYLISLGVEKEQRVAVLVEPGFNILISLLAIFKCNATYIPLDPGFPEQRIQTIIDDVKPRVILSLSHFEHLFNNTQIECLDKIVSNLAQLPTENPNLRTDSDQVAYIFYTSGTTGKPKGILATHRNLIYYLSSAQLMYQLNASDVMTACARSTFSISMFELLLPLINGASVRILRREQLLDLNYMTKVLEQISIMHMGPSLLKLLLMHIKSSVSDLGIFRRLRHLSSGGDLVPPDLLTLAREMFPKIEMYVIYGCSEISCMGCTWPVPEQIPIEKTFVGRPFPDTKALLIDSDSNPVPYGTKGEICFSGKGVVQGYLNNPDLTQQKFIKHSGRIFYRTGDVGIMSFDGNLEILGRDDFQIQFKGIRIEPTEIEFHIKKFRSVKDCIVVLNKTSASLSQLITYYVTYDNKDLNAESLKEFLKIHLPDYMIPSQYQRLGKLPLNFNLKVDRKALMNQEKSVYLENNEKAYSTNTERALASIWKNILSISHISRFDNFFDIGGDSLSAVLMIMEAERKLGSAIYGLDVARESLAIIAAKIDGKDSISDSELISKTRGYSIETSFFGEREELFGAYYRPKKMKNASSILICPPMGQEHVRCDFVLRSLARKLSELGFPTLLFDPYSTGNSHGNDSEISLDRWKKDQHLAFKYLRKISGQDSIKVIAVRLAATIAIDSFYTLPVDSICIWDPILDGKNYINEMKRYHDNLKREMRYIKLFSFKMQKKPKNQLLGTQFSNTFLESIYSLRFDTKKLNKLRKVSFVLSDEHKLNKFAKEHVNSLEVDEYCGWNNFRGFDKPVTCHKVMRAIINSLEL